jgi:hypothetical protein
MISTRTTTFLESSQDLRRSKRAMNLRQLKERIRDSFDLTAAESRDLLIPICEALRERGVVTAEASYSGCGDSGAVDQVSYLPAGIAVPLELGVVVQSWIDATLPYGWEIDDGAQGTVAIDVVAGTAHFDHETNIMGTEDDSFDIGENET